jgi:phospholipid/cholesterol/gamma-HCH transport system ATP-binding protein
LSERPLIDIRNLNTVLSNRVIHKDVNFKAMKGKTTVILGRSGSGKSVLLKIFMRILKPVSGKVFFEGEDILQLKEQELDKIRLKMGVVFQGSALFDSLTVYENVGFVYFQNKAMKEPDIINKVDSLLKWVGLHDIGNLYPGELSGGMRKRVGIARALMADPSLILFDEPTTGLDPIMTDVFSNLCLKLRDEKGLSSIAVTHDMKSAYKIADYIYVMEYGDIIGQGTVSEIQNSSDERIQQFINGRAEGPLKV